MPDLKYRELVNLLLYFGTDLRGEGSPKLKVRNREGNWVSVDCHKTEGCWSEKLGPTLRNLGVSREEFWEWWNAGRKRN